MIITGIGSRDTPAEICTLFTQLGEEIRERGWWVRSGHAPGADYSFELGAGKHCIVYLPWPKFNELDKIVGIPRYKQNLRKEVLDIVYKHEPYAKNLSDSVQFIKSRNVYQVLGEDLKTPSDLVICWTEFGQKTGGTALALKIAEEYAIPIFNFGDPNTKLETLQQIVKEIEL